MPEQISKYPEVTIKVLKGAGALCGEGADQKILKQCPVEQFCSLPTGEICVFGIDDIPTMTQVSTQEIARVVCPKHTEASMLPSGILTSGLIDWGFFLLIGICVGFFWGKFRVRSR